MYEEIDKRIYIRTLFDIVKDKHTKTPPLPWKQLWNGLTDYDITIL